MYTSSILLGNGGNNISAGVRASAPGEVDGTLMAKGKGIRTVSGGRCLVTSRRGQRHSKVKIIFQIVLFVIVMLVAVMGLRCVDRMSPQSPLSVPSLSLLDRVVVHAEALAATAVSINDVVENYRTLMTAAMTGYSMRASIICTSGACMSNSFVAGIEVSGIALSVSGSGKTITNYPNVPLGELFTVLSYDQSPTAVSTEDGQTYRWPLKVDYTRFVNGSAQTEYANRNVLPSFVAKVSLEALMYYGSKQGNGAQSGTDSATYWFDAASSSGSTSAGDPVASLSTGTFTVNPPGGGSAYTMPLSNFTNVTYAVQFAAFESITINTTSSQSTSVLIPTQLRVRETFCQYYYDTAVLDSVGRPTIRRLAGPPGAVKSNWYVQLSSVTPTSFSSEVVSQQDAVQRTITAWSDLRQNGSPTSSPPVAPLGKYGMLMTVSCQGAGCKVGTAPEFPWPALGITASWSTSGANTSSRGTRAEAARAFRANALTAAVPTPQERISSVVYPYTDGSANVGRDLTFDVDARAAAKTMSELLTYALSLPSVNAASNNYPSAGMTVNSATGLVEEMWYSYNSNYRTADNYPSFLGYARVSRGSSSSSSGSVSGGLQTSVPFGPPSLDGSALYTIRVGGFVPNVDYITVTPTTFPSGSGFPTNNNNGSSGGIDRTVLIIIISLSAFFFLCILIVIICCCCYCARRRREKREEEESKRKKAEGDTSEEELEGDFDAVVKPQRARKAPSYLMSSPSPASPFRPNSSNTTIIINAGGGVESSTSPTKSRGNRTTTTTLRREPIYNADGTVIIGYKEGGEGEEVEGPSYTYTTVEGDANSGGVDGHRKDPNEDLEYMLSRSPSRLRRGAAGAAAAAAGSPQSLLPYPSPPPPPPMLSNKRPSAAASPPPALRVGMAGGSPSPILAPTARGGGGGRDWNEEDTSPFYDRQERNAFAPPPKDRPSPSVARSNASPLQQKRRELSTNRLPPTADQLDSEEEEEEVDALNFGSIGTGASPSPHRKLTFTSVKGGGRGEVDSNDANDDEEESSTQSSTYQFRTVRDDNNRGKGDESYGSLSSLSSADDGLPTLGHGGTPYRDVRYNTTANSVSSPPRSRGRSGRNPITLAEEADVDAKEEREDNDAFGVPYATSVLSIGEGTVISGAGDTTSQRNQRIVHQEYNGSVSPQRSALRKR